MHDFGIGRQLRLADRASMQGPRGRRVDLELDARELGNRGEEGLIVAILQTRGANLPLVDSPTRRGAEECGIDVSARLEKYRFAIRYLELPGPLKLLFREREDYIDRSVSMKDAVP
jgi:hypothetical protein